MSGTLRTSERGFTLIETMVAVSLLTVGMLGLVGMQITTISATRYSGKMTQSLMLAEVEASRLLALDWDHADLGGTSKAVVNNLAYGDTFVDPDIYADDPTGVADFCEGLGYDAQGRLVSVAVDVGVFQRCRQLDPEDLNPALAGDDALRIRVFVRFRDIDTGSRWRLASITVVKPKVY